jgi:hypothetical protein
MDEELEAQEITTERYHIEPQWFDAHGRSFVTFVASRMCADTQAKLGTEVEERVATVDKTGKVVFERQMVPFGSNPFKIIRECCSHTKGYISGALPLQEALFRVLLASGNQPMSVEELKDQLDEWYASSGRRRYVELATIKRLMDHDRFYGFRRIDTPLAAEVGT